MNIPLDKIQYKPMIDCWGCKESTSMITKAYTKRYLDQIWIKFELVCSNCGYPFLLNADVKLSDEDHEKMKKENYNIVINTKQQTKTNEHGPVHEIDCTLEWV